MAIASNSTQLTASTVNLGVAGGEIVYETIPVKLRTLENEPLLMLTIVITSVANGASGASDASGASVV